MPTGFEPGLPPGLWPGLWIIATPIGNLSDISERARLALSHAGRILCEDTRRVSQLLHALAIESPGGARGLVRMDAHAKIGQLEQALDWLEAGENLALVTDAGTPAISDPGAELVRLAHERGIRVTPIPGPSAVTALLSVSGFGETSFSFRGFFPRRSSERAEEAKDIVAACKDSGTRVQVWFESPQRVLEALQSLLESLSSALGALSQEVRLCAGKELTKSFEQVWEGGFVEVLNELRSHFEREGEKGEWCFAVLLPKREALATQTQAISDWEMVLRCLLEPGPGNTRIPASDAARRVSQYFGAPKKQAYELALKLRNESE